MVISEEDTAGGKVQLKAALKKWQLLDTDEKWKEDERRKQR